MQNWKQIKLIGKTQKDDFKKPSEDLLNRLKNLQTYVDLSAKKFQNVNTSDECESKIEEPVNDNKPKTKKWDYMANADVSAVDQSEVECMMPSVNDFFMVNP